MQCECGALWAQLFPDRLNWRVLLITVMNLWVP
jgi:hypothetical protein